LAEAKDSDKGPEKNTKGESEEEEETEKEDENEEEEEEDDVDKEINSNTECSDKTAASAMVIKNAWKDVEGKAAAYPDQLNMDECPPLRGFEGTVKINAVVFLAVLYNLDTRLFVSKREPDPVMVLDKIKRKEKQLYDQIS
jgi:hypothetical protein